MKFSLIILLSTLVNLIFAQSIQDNPYVTISGIIKDIHESRISTVAIYITEGTDTIATTLSTSSGKYNDLNFDMGKIVTLHFSKEGYVSKRLMIDAKTNYQKSDSPPINDFEMQLILNKTEPGIDYSSLENNFFSGKLIIDSKTGILSIDYSYTSKQKSQYESMLAKLSKK